MAESLASSKSLVGSYINTYRYVHVCVWHTHRVIHIYILRRYVCMYVPTGTRQLLDALIQGVYPTQERDARQSNGRLGCKTHSEAVLACFFDDSVGKQAFWGVLASPIEMAYSWLSNT